MDDLAKKALALLNGEPPHRASTTAADQYGSIIAVRISTSIIGDFWFCLTDNEPFISGDDLPVYRPSEIRTLKGENYSVDDLRAIHRAKMMMEGKIVGSSGVKRA